MKLYLYVTDAADYLEGKYHFHAVPRENEIEIEGWYLASVVNIDLSAVDEDAIREYALGIIDTQEKETRAEFEVKMNLLKEKRQNLLSITHQPLSVA